MSFIVLDGVRTNNLKNINVKFPIGKLTVVTGVSGSGKSSLVFDTLYSEAYRRYVESLSSFARQYLKALPRPDLDRVENLPPAIAVKQSRSIGTSRSTVGTLTEVADFLRSIFAHIAEIICPDCGMTIKPYTGERLYNVLVGAYKDLRVYICAPLEHFKKISGKDLKTQLLAQGFHRVINAKGEILAIEATRELKEHLVMIDRVYASTEHQRRLSESIDLAFKAGHGRCVVIAENNQRQTFSSKLECPNGHGEFRRPTPALLSFNNPYGACETCQGFGYEGVIDYQKVVPDLKSSLSKGGVIAWNWGKHVDCYKPAIVSAKKFGIDPNKQFKDYLEKDWKWLYHGDGKQFDGIDGYFAWLDEHKHKNHYRIHAARFRKYILCRVCQGGRLNRFGLACKVDNKNIAQMCQYSVKELLDWTLRLKSDLQLQKLPGQKIKTGLMGIEEAVLELETRLNYLMKIGVGYLTFDRPARTLSGGEFQRINMARCLGSALTDTLYCLDEPTVGLHARDSKNLLDIIFQLRDQGNTVVVVEHERIIINGADHLIEIGPEAGSKGGKVMSCEDPGHPESPAKRLGAQNDKAGLPKGGGFKRYFELKDAKTNNLKNVTVKFPFNCFVAVCGVSGSGKTSLIQHTLYPVLAKAFGQELALEKEFPSAVLVNAEQLKKYYQQVVLVSQSALGRSSRSNIATYLGAMDEIRKILAQTERAKKLKLQSGDFSFNVPGGRCETCRGLGTVIEDLSFLGDMAVICPTCEGKRFRVEVLQVDYRGKTLIDILNLTVWEARQFFYDHHKLSQIFADIIEIGMDYITLGQQTSSFSGGEAQRLKLIKIVKEAKRNKASILIFDEPTTGLSDHDVAKLLEQFQNLTAKGHLIIVVEHHLGVLKSADWLIEMGPEAADKGGTVVFQGPPAGIIYANDSLTKSFLFPSTSHQKNTQAPLSQQELYEQN